MERKNILAYIIVIIFFVLAFFLISHPLGGPNIETIKHVKIAGQSVRIDLALTDVELARGLSGRTELADGEGMLFVFNRPSKYLFWMKGMNFPIDIIWIGENMNVIYIKKDARPEFYPDTYGPDTNAKYVLEVASGFSEKYNLQTGERVEFLY